MIEDEQPKAGRNHPPKQHQFKAGGTPWNKGKRQRKKDKVDVGALLREPLLVTIDGRERTIEPLDAELRSLAKRAQKLCMRSARAFLLHCERAGLLEVTDGDEHRYMWLVPKEWNFGEWLSMFDKFGPPPWPGEHDGLIPRERWEENYREPYPY